jgi:hypothetical protein
MFVSLLNKLVNCPNELIKTEGWRFEQYFQKRMLYKPHVNITNIMDCLRNVLIVQNL